MKELKELKEVCKELEILTYKDLQDFIREVCRPDETVLQALKRYLKEIEEEWNNGI